MKLTSSARLAAALMGCAAASAQAQSSVTLYGVFDEGFNVTSNAGGHTAYRMKSGDTVGNRWGMAGTEDLGGDVHAIFRLENGFDGNSGSFGNNGREFGRQAWVGIQSGGFGSVTMGRQYDPAIDLWSVLTTPGGMTGDLAMHPFDNDNSDYDYRVSNSVKYASPILHGLKVEAMYGFSNDTNFANNRFYSVALQYKMDALVAALGYVKQNNPGTTAPNGAVTSDAVFTAASQQNILAGVSYSLPNAKISFAYSHVDLYDPQANLYFGSSAFKPPGEKWSSWKFDNFDLNGKYSLTSAFWIGAGYTFTEGHLHTGTGSFEPKWHQISLFLDYDLSKTTSVYLQGAWQHVVSAHTQTGFDYAYIAGSSGTSSGVNQSVLRLAMIHRF